MHVVDGNVTPEFTKLLVQIAEGYPTTGNLTEGTIRIYAWALGDYTVEQVRDACLRLFRDGSGFFPSTVEILRALGATSVDDAGLLAWAQFRQAAAEVGAYASLEVEDPAAAQALVDVFGSWHAYCEHEEGPALTQRRKEFIAAYRVARARLVHSGGKVPRLFGLLESGGGYVPTTRSIVGRITAAGTIEKRKDTTRALPAAGDDLEIEP
jgi:hypothetical protein